MAAALEPSSPSSRYADPVPGMHALCLCLRRVGHRAAGTPLPTEILRKIFAIVCEATAPPVMQCGTCGWRTTGLRCCGIRPADGAVSSSPSARCGANLVLFGASRLHCPAGCGSCELHCCFGRACVRADVRDAPRPHGTGGQLAHARDVAVAHMSLAGGVGDESPVASCSACGFSVDALLCCGCAKSGHQYVGSHMPGALVRHGFFERVHSAYVWTCPRGCGRKHGSGGKGGLLHGNGSLHCGCEAAKQAASAANQAATQQQSATSTSGAEIEAPSSSSSIVPLMRMLDFLERHGPPE